MRDLQWQEGEKSITIIDLEIWQIAIYTSHNRRPHSTMIRFIFSISMRRYIYEGCEENSFIDVDVKIISNSLDKGISLSNEIDNVLCKDDMCVRCLSKWEMISDELIFIAKYLGFKISPRM